jgi:ribonuclease BN (tRNA processing enzyme)
MDIRFLGTNGWYDTRTGNTSCILLDTREHMVILDAGNGLHRSDAFCSGEKETSMFLSHFHLDHVAGLHILNKLKFRQGLHIYGQPGTSGILETLVAEPFTIPFSRLPFPVTVHELGEGHHEVPFPVECRYLVHASPCMGYRFELDGRTIAYCTDTGFCGNAVALARGADLLIAECSLLPGDSSPGWPHLSPETAIQLAREAGAKRLALMHFTANQYKTLRDRRRIRELYQDDFPGLIISEDGMSIRI